MTPLSPDALFAALEKAGLPVTTVSHPPTHTVTDSAAIDRHLPGGHTKNLFLKDAKGVLFLITAHAETQIDLKQLPKRLRCARLSFARAELLFDVLGVKPGAVTPFALLNDAERQVTFVLDENLMDFDSLNCHPLHNSATTNIARDDFLRFLRLTGHEPRVINLETAKETVQDAT